MNFIIVKEEIEVIEIIEEVIFECIVCVEALFFFFGFVLFCLVMF